MECMFFFALSSHITDMTSMCSTPLYQVVDYALADKSNKTKFTLLYSNVTEKDILLREELDALQKKHPNQLNIVYLLDQPSANWTGKS